MFEIGILRLHIVSVRFLFFVHTALELRLGASYSDSST